MKMLIVGLLLLSGCASLESVKNATPDQAEKLSYLKSMQSEATPLVRIDQTQMNNASRVPRAN